MAFSNLSACSSDLSYSSRICLPGSCDSCTGSSWQVDDCPESCCEPPCCAPSCCTSAPRLTLLCAPVEGDLGSSRNPPGSGSESPGTERGGDNTIGKAVMKDTQHVEIAPCDKCLSPFHLKILFLPTHSPLITLPLPSSSGLDGLKFGLSVVIVSEACGPGKKIVTKVIYSIYNGKKKHQKEETPQTCGDGRIVALEGCAFSGTYIDVFPSPPLYSSQKPCAVLGDMQIKALRLKVIYSQSNRATMHVGTKWPRLDPAHSQSFVWLHICNTEVTLLTRSKDENPRVTFIGSGGEAKAVLGTIIQLLGISITTWKSKREPDKVMGTAIVTVAQVRSRYEMARLLKPSTFPSLDEKETFLNMYVQGAALPARIHEESILIEFRFQDLHLGEANAVPQVCIICQPEVPAPVSVPEAPPGAAPLPSFSEVLPAAKGSFVNRTEAPESHTAAPNAFQRVDDDPGPETCVISSGSRDPAAVVQRGCVVQAPSGTARPPCIPGEANTFSLVSLPGYRVAPKCSSGAPQPEMPLPQEDVSLCPLLSSSLMAPDLEPPTPMSRQPPGSSQHHLSIPTLTFQGAML
ncbi:hypothetical protein MG293_000168 [Ovis ammon polii]|uniref:Uncharacterized protein n=1 Tax=Ovis ammon polii TaxID=230172 RepID=A0AAD4UKA9_OVIAM|nr:hypothetical protein MG293_000168 [Ovis ammon polii]